MNGPCYNCPDRDYGCHSSCSKYLEFKKKQEEINKNRIRQQHPQLSHVSNFESVIRLKGKRNRGRINVND